jgi:hypothetical protein
MAAGKGCGRAGIEQKCATLAPSAGSVSSWYARAVTGSLVLFP